MNLDELSATPDLHTDPVVAGRYDRVHADRFADDELGPSVALLAELAGDGPAVEFAIGTGRVAVPLAATGISVMGMDVSTSMLEHLRAKPEAIGIRAVEGDMTTTRLTDEATLAYLVFNTITNLRTQDLQVACFQNAAAHLAPGGRFLVEVQVPPLANLPTGETIRPFSVTEQHLGFEEFVDPAAQWSISHHVHFDDAGGASRVSALFRYVWPSELDLMARLAGMELEHRWAGWNREPFGGDSERHVSVWRKPVT